MKALLDQTDMIRKKCQQYGQELKAELKEELSSDDPRTACFTMIHNKSVQSLELLSHYFNVWSKKISGSQDKIDDIRNENAERCMELTKMLFIGVMSSIEFCAKGSVRFYSTSRINNNLDSYLKKKKRKFLYLINIIKESFNCELISKKEKEYWKYLIWIRNLMVHNNGVAHTTENYKINDLTINLEMEKMVRGNLDLFLKLTDYSVELYNSWIKSLGKSVD